MARSLVWVVLLLVCARTCSAKSILEDLPDVDEDDDEEEEAYQATGAAAADDRFDQDAGDDYMHGGTFQQMYGGMSDEQSAADIFMQLDGDGDGKLTIAECETALKTQEAGQAEHFALMEAERMLQEADADGDESLTPEEFQFSLTIGGQELISSEARFEFTDKNGDGRLSMEELVETLRPSERLAEYKALLAERAIAQHDANGDKALDGTELSRLTSGVGREEADDPSTPDEAALQDAATLIGMHDTDGSASLDATELGEVLTPDQGSAARAQTNKDFLASIPEGGLTLEAAMARARDLVTAFGQESFDSMFGMDEFMQQWAGGEFDAGGFYEYGAE